MNKPGKYADKTEEIKSLYLSGTSINKISKLLDIPGMGTIANILRDSNIQIKTKSEAITKYPIREDAFTDLTDQDTTYWLGFIFADGSINDIGTLRIELCDIDVEHLEKFRTYLKSSHPIKFTTNKNSCYISVTNKHMAPRLQALGVVPDKTSSLKFPNFLPKSTESHFFRGFSDGDGSLYFRERKRYLTKQGTFSVGGTEDMLIGCAELIAKHTNVKFRKPKISKTKYARGSNFVHSLRYEGRDQLLQIRDMLYKDATTYLDRRHKMFYENL